MDATYSDHMTRTALLIGGTGPTGPSIARGIEARGFELTILHTGRHELAELDHLEHVHTNPFDGDALAAAIGDRTFDVVVATYGRLRAIAALFAGRCAQFISIGGVPAHRGFFDPDRYDPPGLPVPIGEDGPLSNEDDDGKSYRIARTEQIVFELIPTATHVRYPWVYGPRQPAPREWCFVRRALDRRPFVIVPDGGLTLLSAGYTENLAALVHAAIDRPDAAAGHIFNAADDECLTLHQIAELVAAELGHEWEIVSMPWDLAPCTRPMVQQLRTTHRLLDTSKARTLLGYRDPVPAREAVRRTARWLAANPPAPGGIEEYVLEDPFDYASEDALVAWWRDALASAPDITWSATPGFGLAYAGPGATKVRPDTRI
jgi:nucleoside-diphosphate-sugar epimerase